MNTAMRDVYETELDRARAAAATGKIDDAYRHLERAHIIGQRDTWAHVRSHWRMLRLGASLRHWREVSGQGVRIVAAALFSRIWVPLGNTGRSHVSATRPMELPDDLRALMEASK